MADRERIKAHDVIIGGFLGKGCLGRSHPDEPVFTIVARDRLSGDTVRMWAIAYMNLTGCGPDHPKVTGAMAIAAQMDTWRENHDGGKIPD